VKRHLLYGLSVFFATPYLPHLIVVFDSLKVLQFHVISLVSSLVDYRKLLNLKG